MSPKVCDVIINDNRMMAMVKKIDDFSNTQ